MDLFDEELLKPKKKREANMPKIILIIISILIVLLILAVVLIVYLQGTMFTIMLDTEEAGDLENIFIIEENNKIYMPIKKMAEYLGYSGYNGDYTTRSEDTTKCYIETQNKEELVSFTLDSNILTRVIDGQTQQIQITEPIKEINGELCIASDGAQDAFNFKFYYNVEKKEINIYTLSYLYDGYSSYYQSIGYEKIENETLRNKLAVLNDMLIVKASNGSYGVVSTIADGGEILETKYDSITYLQKTSDFLVGSNGKKGIISDDRKTKVELIYDDITSVTNKNDIFYIVKKSELYGMLDENGKTILHPEYEQIGVDVSAYSQNGVTNGYILTNELVPVKLNDKWALYDINGNKITNFTYDYFGSKTNANRTYGVINVPEYNLIVAFKNKKYTLINMDGKEVLNNTLLDSIYITISGGKNVYNATINGEKTELMDFLQDQGIKKNTIID